MKIEEHFNLTKKLHTDVLEQKYGPIQSVVLQHDMFLREVFLCDKSNTGRTYALSFFEQDLFDPEIASIDSAIKNGGLIGKTFRDHGFEVRKNVTDVFIVDLPKYIQDKFADGSEKAKARLSEFYAKKENGQPIIYATVMEVYSPDFRPAEINNIDNDQIHPTTIILEHAGFSRQEIWNHLDEGSHFDLSDQRYIRAVNFYNASKSDYKSNYFKSKKSATHYIFIQMCTYT
jgi:chorismate-pyruvate lyase